MEKIAIIFTGLVKIDKNLVGTAVIYRQIAEIFQRQGYRVKMVVPELSFDNNLGVEYYRYQDKNNRLLIKQADVVIFGAYPPTAPLLEAYRQKKIIATYLWSIAPIGSLEFKDYKSPAEQAKLHRFITASYNLSLLLSDKIFCRDEGVRKLVLGSLISLGRVNLDNYQKDSGLHNLVEAAPFGVDGQKLPKIKGGYWQKYAGIKPGDFILVWNGGIWNWNDGETLVRAMSLLKKYRIKLVFQGFKHPEPGQKSSVEAEKTLALAEHLRLINKNVFFIDDWVPYNERYHFLGNSDAGIVCSPDIPEANLFFKTRVYDYLWAELPVILGDCEAFVPLIKTHGLGLIAKTGVSSDWAKQILLLSRDINLRRQIRKNIKKYKQTIGWEKTLSPVKAFAMHPAAAADRLAANNHLAEASIRLSRDIVSSF